MQSRPSTRETVELLKRLLGAKIKLVMEDHDRPGMARGYVGRVRIVFKLSGRWMVKLDDANYEIGKIEHIEIDGPFHR